MKQHYNSHALTPNEQLALLNQRGVLSQDTTMTQQRLSSVGFYRLFSYAKPLLTEAKVITFESVWDLYLFDRKLRLLMLQAIEIIEVAFRVAISERMSRQYDPFWYRDASHFNHPQRHADFMTHVMAVVHRRQHPLIKQYYDTYASPTIPPSWMLIECLTFGNWSKVFHNLKTRHDKKAIAQTFGQSFKTIESWMVSLLEVRNICAHHERLWNHIFHYPPKDAPHDVRQHERFYQQGYIIDQLLRYLSPDSDWRLALNKLFKEHPKTPFHQMGFIPHWEADSFWMS